MARKMLTIEMAEDYTGFSGRMLREAVKRGDIKAVKPGKSLRSRLYFEQAELDRWLAAIEVYAEAE